MASLEDRPLAPCWKADIMDAPNPRRPRLGRMAVPPVGCAAGLAVFDVIEEEETMVTARHK